MNRDQDEFSLFERHLLNERCFFRFSQISEEQRIIVHYITGQDDPGIINGVGRAVIGPEALVHQVPESGVSGCEQQSGCVIAHYPV